MSPASGPAQANVHGQHEPQEDSISSAAPTSIAAPPEAAADVSPPPPPPPSSVGSRLPQQPGDGGGRGADGWSPAAAAVGQKGKKKEKAERDEERKSDSLGRRSVRVAYHGHAKEEVMSKKLPWDDPRLRKEQVTPVSTINKSHRTSALGCINKEEIDGLLVVERPRFGPPYVACNEFTLMWSLKNDEIWYPLFAEILGDADKSIESFVHCDRKAKGKLEGFEIPQNLVCPLCGNVMVDPVMIATGKTMDRHCVRAWFDKHGHICPVTCQPVSSTVLRNERIRGYVEEWHEAELEVEEDARVSFTRP
uniref:U-box domain-containing protein n=1 Tax=Oryza rufipogon TaxID=4529 RepID=A0A0E0QG04_ORYRU